MQLIPFTFSLDNILGGNPEWDQRTWIPAIDVIEESNQYRIKAEIPGLNKEDIQLAIDGKTLTLSGTKKKEVIDKSQEYVRTERVYGQFYRSMTLPETIDKNHIQAVYKNGVLELFLKKKEVQVPEKIDIKVE